VRVYRITKLEKRQKSEKWLPKIDEIDPTRSKIARKLKNDPRKTSTLKGSPAFLYASSRPMSFSFGHQVDSSKKVLCPKN
jgi:hypothetical protein